MISVSWNCFKTKIKELFQSSRKKYFNPKKKKTYLIPKKKKISKSKKSIKNMNLEKIKGKLLLSCCLAVA